MSAFEDLTAGLTSATTAALSVRPPIGGRTASSRSLPKRAPLVTVCIPAKRVPEELRTGVQELAQNSPRNNVKVVDEVPRELEAAWVVGCVAATAAEALRVC